MELDNHRRIHLWNLTTSSKVSFPRKWWWSQSTKSKTTLKMVRWSNPTCKTTQSTYLCSKLTWWGHLTIQASTTQLESTTLLEQLWIFSTKWSRRSIEFQRLSKKYCWKSSRRRNKRDVSWRPIKVMLLKEKSIRTFGWNKFIPNWKIDLKMQ